MRALYADRLAKHQIGRLRRGAGRQARNLGLQLRPARQLRWPAALLTLLCGAAWQAARRLPTGATGELPHVKRNIFTRLGHLRQVSSLLASHPPGWSPAYPGAALEIAPWPAPFHQRIPTLPPRF